MGWTKAATAERALETCQADHALAHSRTDSSSSRGLRAGLAGLKGALV